MSVLIVFALALGTALATGLGVLPVIGVRVDETRAIAISGAVAAGFMLGASIGLIYEGTQSSVGRTVIGVAVGTLFIVVSGRVLDRTGDAHVGNLRGARGMTALLVIGVMTVHSLAEGVALGVGFVGEDSLGLLIAIAIAIHNIPEGVAISLALIPHGESPYRAAAWSIFSSLPQPIMAVPAYLAVRTFEPLLPAGLGFAAGAMGWMVFGHLLPDAMKRPYTRFAITAFVSAAAVMIAMELALGL